MFRLLFAAVLFFCTLLFPFNVFAQDIDTGEVVAAPFAVTANEKKQLLDKAEETLKWFRPLTKDVRQKMPPNKYREKILPMELMQAAVILKQKNQGDMSRMVREILPFLQPTPFECFEIAERLGDNFESFEQEKEILTGDTPDSVTRITEGADLFLKGHLRPIEKMALYKEPETALDIMKAVDVLAVAGRPVLIRYYLKKFLALEITPEEYAQIADLLGSQKLMQIANNKNFVPHGSEVVTKIYAESKKHWQEDYSISQALEDWKEEIANKKKKTESAEPLSAVWKGDKISASQLIEKLGESSGEKETDELLAAILSFKTDGRELLAVSLQSDNVTLAANASRGLSEAVNAEEVFLLFPVLFTKQLLSDKQRDQIVQKLKQRGFNIPDAETAASVLFGRAKDYLEKNRQLLSDPDGYVRFWNWEKNEKKPKFIRMLLPAAYRLFAHRYAEYAYRIKPEIQDIRRLYLTALFERTAYINGLDEPLDLDVLGLNESVAKIEPDTKQQLTLLEQILKNGIEKEYFAAAQVAVSLLGKLGGKELLYNNNGKPTPLIQAAVAKDRRVRFAVLEAVMSLNPDAPYPGSSLVTETLVWFSRADGRRVLVSAHPKRTNAAKTAGYFIGCGYKGELAMTCREAMQLAAETPDTEIVVIDTLCSEPPIANFVQEMRNDARTANVPIAVLSNDEKILESAPNLLSRSTMQKTDRLNPNAPFAVSLSQIYPRVVSDEGAQWVNGDLFEKTGVEPIPPAIRLEQARKALGWIKEIIETVQDGQKIYHFEGLEDTVSRALRSDVRIYQGLELAAVIKSGTIQAAIYEVAADAVYPLELREKAAEYFEQSINSFGVLLRGKQVQRLYDRYNVSEAEPKETQELLGKLIDIVEKKTLQEKKQ